MGTWVQGTGRGAGHMVYQPDPGENVVDNGTPYLSTTTNAPDPSGNVQKANPVASPPPSLANAPGGPPTTTVKGTGTQGGMFTAQQIATTVAAKQQADADQAATAQQDANNKTRATLLGAVADPMASSAVQKVNQQNQNTANAIASATSTNAYQQGDIAQAGHAGADASEVGAGAAQLATQGAAAQAETDALSNYGNFVSGQTSNDISAAQGSVQNQAQTIQTTLQGLTSEASNLDAAQKQQIQAYSNQVQDYMQKYQEALKEGDAGRQEAIGWLKLALGVVGSAAAVVGAAFTGGATLAALPGTIALAGSGASQI